MGDPNYNEYWLDDEGTESIIGKGEAISFIVDGDLYKDVEYKYIKEDGLLFGVYPDNTLCFKGIDYKDTFVGSDDNFILPSEINDMPVTRIASEAFKNCPYKSITLPEDVEFIEPLAFSECQNLEIVNFPKNIKYVAPCAFYECYNLKNLKIDRSEMEIFYTSFYNCDINELSICAKSVPYFRKDTTLKINNINILSGTKEIDVNYLTDGTEIPETVKVISGRTYYKLQG